MPLDALDPFAAVGAVPVTPTADAGAAPRIGPGSIQLPQVPGSVPLGNGEFGIGQGAAPTAPQDQAVIDVGGAREVPATPSPGQTGSAPAKAPVVSAPHDPFAAVGAIPVEAPSPNPTAAPPPATNPRVPGGTLPDVAVHALSLGGDDVLLPAIGASLNSLLRPMIPGAPSATWSEDYTRLQAEQRANRHAYEGEHPVASAVAGTLGGIATPGVGELFGAAVPGADLVGKAVNFGRNVAAGSGLGAAAGFGEAEGDLNSRLQGAKTGAEVGGALSAAAPAVPAIAGAIRAGVQKLPVVGKIVSPVAREASVASNLNATAGGAPIETSPVGPLDLAQATNSPAAALKVDYAKGIPEGAAPARALADQQGAAITREIGDIGAPSTTADASAKFTGALRASHDLARSEETRLWTVPKLARTEITPTGIQQSVNTAVADMDPVLRDSMSPSLRALVNRLNRTGPTTMRDMNGIRSDLLKIARETSDGAERSMANTLSTAFMEGLDKTPEIVGAPAHTYTPTRTHGNAGPPLAPVTVPEVVADPEIAAAYQTARDYTKRMRTLFADPQSASLLAKTEGVYRKDPSEGARLFFNFSNGSVEGPQSIAELAAFVDTLRHQPGSGQVAQDLREAARSFVAAALSKASRLDAGPNFNAKLMQDFLRINTPWMRNSGLFEPAQIAAANRLLDYAGMLRRTDQLITQANSATNRRSVTGDAFVDQVMRPWIRRLAELATIAGGAESTHGSVGAMIGVGAAAGFEKAVAHAEHAMRELMAAAVLDSRVAADLQRKVSAGNQRLLAPQTVALMQRIGSEIGGESVPAPAVSAPSAIPAAGVPR